MPTRKCLSCGAVFDISDRLAGRTFACDACGKMLAPPRTAPSAPAPGHGSALDPCKSCGRFIRDQIRCPACKDHFCSEACLHCHAEVTGHRASANLLPFIGAGVLAVLVLAYCGFAFGPSRREPPANPPADYSSPGPVRVRLTPEPARVAPGAPQPQVQPAEAVANTSGPVAPVAHATPAARGTPAYLRPALPPQVGDSPDMDPAASQPTGAPKMSNNARGFVRKDGGFMRMPGRGNK
jgi:hypothetical protein